jgi:hypothetical protein
MFRGIHISFPVMMRLKKVTFVLLAVQKALAGIQKFAFERFCQLLENFMKACSVEDDYIFGAMTDLQTIFHLISKVLP